MNPRITQIDVARVAGVHNTTVSLSLRNSRLIPPTTRERIQTIAKNMGYCPDPALRALAVYRNLRRQDRRTTTLAYVTNWETKWGWRDQPWLGRYFLGAQRRAVKFGYQIEHFWLREAGMSQKRLSDMLLHRGISGVVFASQPMCAEFSGLDWSRLSAVRVGFGAFTPALNQVAINQGSILNLSLQRIAAAGYQRVGFVLSRDWDGQVMQAWSKAFFAEQFLLAPRHRIPILYVDSFRRERDIAVERPDDPRALANWYREHEPEIIIGLAPQLSARLARAGVAVPQDAAFVDLFLEEATGEFAGIRQNCERVGELAVETLARQLQENEFDVPAVPTLATVGGDWIEGASLPDRAELVAANATRMTANLVA